MDEPDRGEPRRSGRARVAKINPNSVTNNTLKDFINSQRIQDSKAARRAYETYKRRQTKAGEPILPRLKWYDDIYMKRKSPPVRPKASTFRGVDAKLVPCVPAIINESGVEFQYETLNVMGHNYTKYKAGWLSVDEDMFGAFVRRINNKNKNKKLFQTRHLYVGNVHKNIAEQISSPEGQILKVMSATQYTNNNLNTLNANNRIFIQPEGAGPGVGVTKSYIRKMPSYDLDLLSFKLIGDRFTVTSAKWVNSETNRFFVKPYNYDIAKKLADIYSSGKKGTEVKEDLKSLKEYYYKQYFEQIPLDGTTYDLPNFIFAGSVVLTNDRSLCLYAIFNQVPFIYESKSNYRYVDTNKVRALYTTYFSKNTPRNEKVPGIINSILESASDEKITDTKLAVLDCFHDFVFGRGAGPEAAPLDFERLKETFTKLFTDRQKLLLDYLNEFKNKQTVENAQDWITEIIDSTALVEGTNFNLTQNSKNIRQQLENLSFSISIDAGQRPEEFNNRIITSGLARHINSASRTVQPLGTFRKLK